MMIRKMLLSVLVMALLGSFNSAFAVSTQDSATWPTQVNGSVLPSAESPAFSEQNGDANATTTANSPSPGIMTLLVTGRGVGGEYGWSRLSGFLGDSSVEIKMKVISSNANGRGIQIRQRSSAAGIYNKADVGWHVFLDGSITGGGAGGSNGDPSGNIPGGGVATDWHIYRMTRDVTGYVMYIDNDPNPVFGPWGANGIGVGTQNIAFQIIGDGEVEVDWFRATGEGAFVPIPEPASLALLSLGGLMLIRRRR